MSIALDSDKSNRFNPNLDCRIPWNIYDSTVQIRLEVWHKFEAVVFGEVRQSRLPSAVPCFDHTLAPHDSCEGIPA